MLAPPNRAAGCDEQRKNALPMMSKQEVDDLPEAPSPEIIIYIRHMLGELRTMASGQREDMLVYLIEMAAVEAGDIVSRRRAAS